MSFLRSLLVFLVLCLISFIAYSSQIFIIWPWYGRELSVELLTLLVPFNILVGILFWSYLLCVFTDPGRVPDTWKPDTHADGYEVKKLTGTPRFCRMCKKYKPPRSHHCRVCNRCVLRMDHHCPWINNCVGHFNYGHFIRFLFFVDVACLYHLTMVTKRIIYTEDGYWVEPPPGEFMMIIFNFVACVPVLLAVGGFSVYHFYGLISNTTTIENWEKDKVAVMIRRGEVRQIRFPYDLGMRRNIESILGPNPLLWWYPGHTPGSGLKFGLSNKDGEEWPPREPDMNESSIHSSIINQSPWTYENNSLNPNLQPSNSQTRKRNGSQISIPGASSLPPYHPDYRQEDQGVYKPGNDEGDESSDEQGSRFHIRRGSEGYEVRPEGREEMLRRYLTEVGEEPGRYVRYIPQPDSDDSVSDDDIPLGRRREMIGQS